MIVKKKNYGSFFFVFTLRAEAKCAKLAMSLILKKFIRAVFSNFNNGYQV